MRRILLLVAGALALALAVPGIASAHRGHAARSHHHRHHRHDHGAKAHHTSTPSAPADAGRVASFTGGVLTITLADGSTVGGKVTNDTVIGCVPAVQTPAPTAAAAHDGGWNGQGGQGDQRGHGRCHGPSACTTADLVPGAVVHEAILKLGANGAEFKLVLLVKQPAA